MHAYGGVNFVVMAVPEIFCFIFELNSKNVLSVYIISVIYIYIYIYIYICIYIYVYIYAYVLRINIASD